MSGNLRISLRAGERLFINGAVIKADRKVSLELLNDVVFLLEQHVMKPEETTTPLRQLYFMVQMMLMDPSLHLKAKEMAFASIAEQLAAFSEPNIRQALGEIKKLLEDDRPLEALKRVRAAFAIEEALVAAPSAGDLNAKEVA